MRPPGVHALFGDFAHASLLTAQCETQLSYGGREMCSATMRCCALSSAALCGGYTFRRAGHMLCTGAPAPGRRVCCRLGVCGACSLLGCAARVTRRVGAVNGWEVVFGVGVFACWVSRLGLLAVVGEAVLCILSSVG